MLPCNSAQGLSRNSKTMLFLRLPSTPAGGFCRCVCPFPVVIMFTASTIHVGSVGDFTQPGQGQNQLSDQLIFFLQLPVEAIHFRFLKPTDDEVAFRWPATVGAKPGGIGEPKTTIETIFRHSCSPPRSSPLLPSLLEP